MTKNWNIPLLSGGNGQEWVRVNQNQILILQHLLCHGWPGKTVGYFKTGAATAIALPLQCTALHCTATAIALHCILHILLHKKNTWIKIQKIPCKWLPRCLLLLFIIFHNLKNEIDNHLDQSSLKMVPPFFLIYFLFSTLNSVAQLQFYNAQL